jgi:DNA-binding response OmpR family regulator
MRNRKILVVDDEEVIRKYLNLQLNKWGYDVVEAEDGAIALLKLESKDIDLIILDIMMPNKNGWELLKELKLNERTKNIPVIILTAKNRDEDMFKGYEMGASYYLPKPFTKEQLLYGIKMMFDENQDQNTSDLAPFNSLQK